MREFETWRWKPPILPPKFRVVVNGEVVARDLPSREAAEDWIAENLDGEDHANAVVRVR